MRVKIRVKVRVGARLRVRVTAVEEVILKVTLGVENIIGAFKCQYFTSRSGT